MNKQHLMNIGRKHLQQHLPGLFEQLMASGELDQHLESAATHTIGEMNSLIEAGYSQDEAWQMTRERYLIIRPGDEDEDEYHGSVRTRGIFQTLQDMRDLREEADELEAQASYFASHDYDEGTN